MKVTYIKRSEIDAMKTGDHKKEVDEKLKKRKSRKADHMPIAFVGKGGKGYVLKSLIKHRGKGSMKVSKNFRDCIRLFGTDKEHMLTKNVAMRAKAGGPRYGSMGNSVNNRR